MSWPALLLGGLLPFVLSLLGLLLLARSSVLRPAAGLISLAAGYAAGHVGLYGWPTIPARERLDWLFYMALLSAAVGAWLFTMASSSSWSRPLFGAVALLTALLLMWPQLRDASWTESVAMVAGLAAAVLAWWASLDALAGRAPAKVWLPPIGFALAGAGIVTALSGTAKVAQVPGILGMTLLAHCWPALRGGMLAETLRSDLWALAIVLSGSTILGHYYSDVPAWAILPVCLAAQAGWLARVPGIRSWRPRWQVAICCTVAALVVAVPVGLTVHQFLQMVVDRNDYGAAETPLQPRKVPGAEPASTHRYASYIPHRGI